MSMKNSEPSCPKSFLHNLDPALLIFRLKLSRVVCINCAHIYMENRIVGRKTTQSSVASWTLRGRMVNKDDGVLSYCQKEAPPT
jgi:hypothetical protein